VDGGALIRLDGEAVRQIGERRHQAGIRGHACTQGRERGGEGRTQVHVNEDAAKMDIREREREGKESNTQTHTATDGALDA
jgi:hypothetical protein